MKNMGIQPSTSSFRKRNERPQSPLAPAELKAGSRKLTASEGLLRKTQDARGGLAPSVPRRQEKAAEPANSAEPPRGRSEPVPHAPRDTATVVRPRFHQRGRRSAGHEKKNTTAMVDSLRKPARLICRSPPGLNAESWPVIDPVLAFIRVHWRPSRARWYMTDPQTHRLFTPATAGGRAQS